MKAQTHHTNVFGTVTNPSTATGFTLEDDHGGRVEANVVDGLLVVEYVSAELTYTQRNLDPVCKKCKGPLMPIRTIAELVKATADMRPEQHCIWPDCGHDTNQSDPRPGCNGKFCPVNSGSGS